MTIRTFRVDGRYITDPDAILALTYLQEKYERDIATLNASHDAISKDYTSIVEAACQKDKLLRQALEALNLNRIIAVPSGREVTPKIQMEAIKAIKKELGYAD